MYMSMIALLSFINTAFSEIVPPDQPNAWLAAFGDSDASGTGAGDYIPGSEACFRYTQSYPEKLRHAGLKEGNDVINRACHGATIQDVQTVQLNPKEKSSVATLTVGKEDISWSAVLYNCVLRRHPLEPDDVNGFPPLSSCDDQLKQTHKHIDKDNITGKLSTLYTAIIENRQKDPKFRLYVLGYPMPFNDEKGSCSNLTLVRNHWRRHPDSSKHTDRADAGRPSVLLTQSRRHSINQVVRNLNSKIQEAVDRVSFHGVIYVDVDQFIINHRICDDDQTDQSLFETDKPNIYLYNYPYDYAKSADIAYTKIVNDSLHSGDFPILQKGQVSSTDVDHQILNDLIPLKAKQMLTPEKNLNDLWSFVGNEYKTFHYKPELHEKIQQFITNDYNQPKDQNTSFWILSSKYMDDHNVKTVRVDQGKFGVTIMQPLLNSVDSKAKTDTGNVSHPFRNCVSTVEQS